MLFKSEHRTFNRKADLISTGNVVSNVQKSSYIRPFSETECNGIVNPPGHLRDFDLKPFLTTIPSGVLKYVESVSMNKQVVLYRIQHYVGERRVIHGWIVTKDWRENHGLLRCFSNGGRKSRSVIDEAVKYLTDGK
jgi:hypothetical protein